MARAIVALLIGVLLAGCSKPPRPAYEYEDTVTETWTGTPTSTTLAPPTRWEPPKRW